MQCNYFALTLDTHLWLKGGNGLLQKSGRRTIANVTA
jgi:hypothetical protein